MKILYNSCHAILEYDEVKLFTELGHTVFSLGAYSNGGKGHYLLPRPSIVGMQEFPDLEKMSREFPRGNLPEALLSWADVIIDMHDPNFIVGNWDKIVRLGKATKVVWRSIGQSTMHVENMIRRMRYDGMKIVRMSPMEENISGYLGSDALIRFYKDPDEWKEWNGNMKRAINFTQSLLGRRVFCHYDAITQLLNGFPALIYGSGNTDLGSLDGGELTYDGMRGQLRENRTFIYGGTWPSPYTLSFIEAFMVGIPVVSIAADLAEKSPDIARNDQYHYFEIPDIIDHGKNGFVSDNINELREIIHTLLENQDLASQVGEQGRKTAIRLFGKQKITEEWQRFFSIL